jgi:hypothetical protein
MTEIPFAEGVTSFADVLTASCTAIQSAYHNFSGREGFSEKKKEWSVMGFIRQPTIFMLCIRFLNPALIVSLFLDANYNRHHPSLGNLSLRSSDFRHLAIAELPPSFDFRVYQSPWEIGGEVSTERTRAKNALGNEISLATVG